MKNGSPEYFLLRPALEQSYGYAHAIRIGDSIRISGAVSMDDDGNPTAIGDIDQQTKNVYSDLEKILAHFGCTFDDDRSGRDTLACRSRPARSLDSIPGKGLNYREFTD